MPGVFRRRWFPRRSVRAGIASLNATANLVGLESIVDTGTFSFQETKTATGQSVTADVGTPVFANTSNQVGVAATTASGAFALQIDCNESLIGVQATTGTGILAQSATFTVFGVSATTQFTPPLVGFGLINFNLTGVSATTAVGSVVDSLPFALTGVHVTADLPDPAFFVDKNIVLTGQRVLASTLTTSGAGGGGGGAAGIYGAGQKGIDGSPGVGGGVGGSADGGLVTGAIASSTHGNSGTEFDSQHGSGSGGAGAIFDSNAGATSYNYNGSISLTYISSVTGKVNIIFLSDNAQSPFTIPGDWTNQNFISVTGAGCATPGVLNNQNTVLGYVPGQSVPYFCAPSCSGLDTTFDTFSAACGDGVAVLLGRGGDGGLYGGGGAGGTGGGGGRGSDGLIWMQYIGSGSVKKTIIFNASDNPNSPWTVPADWSNTNFIALMGSGGNGAVGSATDGGNGGGGGGCTAVYNTSTFTPGETVTFFVSPGGSLLPTTLGQFAATSGRNGDSPNTQFGLQGFFVYQIPCGTGVTGIVGDAGPTPP